MESRFFILYLKENGGYYMRIKRIVLVSIVTVIVLTVIGVCGVRLLWIATVFPKSKTFKTIMMAYPLSLSFTAVLIFILLIMFRPSKRYAKNNK